MLYELIAGRRAFRGDNSLEVIASILKEDPVALPNDVPSELAAVIMRCLEKDPHARFSSAHELREALAEWSEGRLSSQRRRPESPPPQTRVMVLPFRMLRRDDDLDFLAYSLPDAIVGSLAGINSLIVRSSLAASQYAGAPLDIARIAAEQDVNAIVSGTILASGGRLRVSAQLTEMPSAAVKWSHSTETSLDDIFGVQDELTRKIVRSLSGPMSDSDSRALRKDVPLSPVGYEFFLRANQQAHAPAGWLVARDLYNRSIEEDPNFAPAWARLGRTHWVISKYTDEPGDHWKLAEEALRRAIELNPDLSLAQRFYAELEIESEGTIDSLQRLKTRVQLQPNDPDLRVALAKALRYSGLLQESLDAFLHARKLDPSMKSSIGHTYFMLGDYERAHSDVHKDIFYMLPLTLIMLGRAEEARSLLRETVERNPDRQFHAYHESLLWIIEGNHDAALRAIDTVVEHNRDPEALFYMTRAYARIDEREKALDLLERVSRGFFAVYAFEHDPWLEPLRHSPRFREILRSAAARHAQARAVWEAAGVKDSQINTGQ
jgi:TolB-like protein/Flp pilus assembly protein TadD